MTKKTYIILAAFILFTALILLGYLQFKGEREENIIGLSNVEFSFETKVVEEVEVVNFESLRYTDVTYLDILLNVVNRGEQPIILENPILTFSLEDEFVLTYELEDVKLQPNELKLIELNDLTFKSDVITEALKGRVQRPEATLSLRGEVAPKFTFEIRDIVIRTYRLESTFSGKVLLTEIFGGRTGEEAADVILGINRSAAPTDIF
jgi:hypothetical protein